ncbi:hypothetical protein ACLOJK_034779 [Asimina triloba]
MVLHHHHGRQQPWLPPMGFTDGVRSVDRTPQDATIGEIKAAPSLPLPPDTAGRVDEGEDEGSDVAGEIHQQGEHHRAIQVVHHDRNIKAIPDPSRPQGDVDHSSHPRQARLLRHRRVCLHPAPVIAYFRSQRHHLSISIFMAHLKDMDLTIDHHSDDEQHFLPELISPSISMKPSASLSSPAGHQSHRRCEPVPTAVDCRHHRRLDCLRPTTHASPRCSPDAAYIDRNRDCRHCTVRCLCRPSLLFHHDQRPRFT